MQRLSGADAAFLYLENHSSHMHVAMTGIFDESTIPGGYSFEKVRDLIAERAQLIPPFRRRLVHVPFDLNHPMWVDDNSFDIDFHLRRVAVPAPGGRRELAELAGRIASLPLDRRRPLWEAWIIEGLKQDRFGLVCKVHHSAIDGVSGADIMTVLYDISPEGREVEVPEPTEPERVPSDAEMIGWALRSRFERYAGAPALISRTIQGVSKVISNRLSQTGGQGAVPLTAPHTPFNGPISPHRRVSFARVSLSDTKFIKNTFDVTVNDVVLAITSGALRNYLLRIGELPDDSLVACCPISVRQEDEHGEFNNRVSAMFSHLHTEISDPILRLVAISDSTSGAKGEHNAIGAAMLTDWTEWAAPRTFGLAARTYSSLGLSAHHRPIHNLVISNVPGPPIPLYFAGAKMIAAYPMGPIMDGAGINVTVLSYEDHIDFGFMVDRDMVPDPWMLAETVEESFADLLAAAKKRTEERQLIDLAEEQRINLADPHAGPVAKSKPRRKPAAKATAAKAAPAKATAAKATAAKATAAKATAAKATAAAGGKAPSTKRAAPKKAQSAKETATATPSA